jgi:hypothetical protein
MPKAKLGAQEKQSTAEKRGPRVTFSRPLILLIVVLVAFAGIGTYGIMSDMSIHGLTIKFYNVSRYCPAGTTTVTFSFGSVVVFSSNSLPTSLHQVSFAVSADGFPVATIQVADSSFNPGQSAMYSNLVFSNGALDPSSQPSSSTIGLTINAQVGAGLFSSQASSSITQVVNFGSPPC